MTKRLTFALVAVALFVLLAVMPAAAANFAANGSQIDQGATIFIGESGLNLTHAMNKAQRVCFEGNGDLDQMPTNLSIGWWASAAAILTTAPSREVSLAGRLTSFTVGASDFLGYDGNWYLLDGQHRAIQGAGPLAGTPALVVTVKDPTLDVKVWDAVLQTDQTGKSVPQGQGLQFRIETNMYAASYANRNNTMWNQTSVLDDTGTPADTIKATWGYIYSRTHDGAWNITSNATDTLGLITNYTADGFINVVVKDASGATLNALLNANTATPTVQNAAAYTIKYNYVNVQPFTWGVNNRGGGSIAWMTDALDTNGQYAYPPGAYTFYAESKLNSMKDNYKNAGADYTGKTVSPTYTVTLTSDTVKLEANKDSVTRSKSFSVTITGKPSAIYHLWVKGTSTMTGGYDDQPPMIKANQEGVAQDAFSLSANPVPPTMLTPGLITASYPGGEGRAAGATNAGGYRYQNGAGQYIWQDVAAGTYDAVDATKDFRTTLGNGTYLYANVTTSPSGTRTVEFVTTNWTKVQSYTLRVERNMTLNGYKSDEVNVKVEKGAVTIVAAGDQNYYLGEEIKFSGTNTETYKTYLFLVGPNLPTTGASIKSSDPRLTAEKVINGQEAKFQVADVQGDNTWSWKWGTANIALDAGTYTVYAVSQPKDKDNLAQAAYGTVSIIIKKPFVSATASQSTVAKGDKLFITGTAEGQPSKGVQIWILGKNYAVVATESVNADASFKYEVTQATTKDLYAGQYFIVVQHPMQNNAFDIRRGDADQNNVWNYQLAAGQKIFALLGAGSLQGSDAAEALVQGINDPNVDDTYTKLQFLVEEPVLRIDPIGDKHVGDKFTITAQTNLAVDDEVLVQVYSSSFKPTQKSQSGEFSGATGTVKVAKGDAGMNMISFAVDSSTFKPDEYIVTASAILQVITGTALFNVLEGAAPTAAPTAVVTAAPTAVVTAAPTAAPTAVPTPIPTTKSPGYGALIALIGLGAVAFIVVRRH